MFKILLLAALVPAVMLQNSDKAPHHEWSVAKHSKCSGNKPLPRAVRIENCPGEVCEIRKGSTANMAMDFTAGSSTTKLTTKATAYLSIIPIPYELPTEIANACSWLDGARCPIDKGEDLTYVLAFPIGDYPSISLDIEIDIVDDNKKSQGCFRIKARVA